MKGKKCLGSPWESYPRPPTLAVGALITELQLPCSNPALSLKLACTCTDTCSTLCEDPFLGPCHPIKCTRTIIIVFFYSFNSLCNCVRVAQTRHKLRVGKCCWREKQTGGINESTLLLSPSSLLLPLFPPPSSTPSSLSSLPCPPHPPPPSPTTSSPSSLPRLSPPPLPPSPFPTLPPPLPPSSLYHQLLCKCCYVCTCTRVLAVIYISQRWCNICYVQTLTILGLSLTTLDSDLCAGNPRIVFVSISPL